MTYHLKRISNFRRGHFTGCFNLLCVILFISLVQQTALASNNDLIATDKVNITEEGVPLFRNFLAKEYASNIQNWAVTQTPEGMVYVGNTNGVLEFDGINWRLITIDNQTIARSLAVDPKTGRVYVGAVGELGYLAPNAQGKMHFVSMLHNIDLAERDFADIWQTFYSKQGIYFSSFQRLFRVSDKGVKSWSTSTSFHFSFQVGERIFIREVGRGLLELIDDELVLLEGTEQLANERVYAMVAFPDKDSNELLLVTRTQGLLLYKDDAISHWKTSIDKLLKRDLTYVASWLPNGRLAICTLQGGIYIIDKSGNLINNLNTKDGLPSNAITALKIDNEGGIWATTTRGITRFSANDSITEYNSFSGLESGAYTVKRFDGDLYAGTSQGLYVLNSGPNAHFTMVPGVKNQIWDILPVQDRLLVGNYLGLYEVTDKKAKLLFPFDTAFSMHPSSQDKNKVFVGQRQGINSIRLENGVWIDEGPIHGIKDEIRSIWQEKNGNLWVASYTKGIIRVEFNGEKLPKITQYGISEGLPSDALNSIEEYEGAPLFLTKGGLYFFDENTQRFIPDARFANLFNGDKREILAASNVPELGLWIITGKGEFLSNQSGLVERQSDNRYVWRRKMLNTLDKFTNDTLYLEPDGVLWVAGSEGVFRVDTKKPVKNTEPFSIVLRKVTTGDGKVKYAGAGKPSNLEIPFEGNRMRFEFSALTFNELNENKYEVKLLGADSTWSPSSKEAFKDYSNLWEGHYELWLRAENQEGTIQESKIYTFTILPPWYRSLLAYFCYLVLLVTGVWSIFRWRLGRLRAQKRMLRKQVQERTRQLAMLGKIGRDITATLDLDAALESVYTSINSMLDARVFGIGLYRPEKQDIEFRLAIEQGQRYEPYVRKMQDKNQLAVWCVDYKETIAIGNLKTEYSRYIPTMESHTVTLKDGTETQQPISLLYVPILLQQVVVGVLTVQSIEAYAYHSQHIRLLQTLASYTAIAIDNSRAHAKLLIAYKTMEEISVTDQLTGLKNRHFLSQYIENDINKLSRDYENCIRDGQKINADESVHVFFIIDLDHFKQVNDTYGHAAGDMVLIQIKDLLSDVFRGSDYLIRWGGEEFLTIARFTRKSCGTTLAERVRSVIEHHDFDIGETNSIKMTASIGFAAYPFYDDSHELITWQQVVKIADQCLYYAKNNNRNAWVGGSAVENLSAEGLFQIIQDEPQKLLESTYIKLSSSIFKK